MNRTEPLGTRTTDTETISTGRFRDGLEHLIAEAEPIRLMLEEKVERMIHYFESQMDSPYKGYGITPDEVREHLRRAEEESTGDSDSLDPAASETLRRRVQTSLADGVNLPLVRLQQLFGLGPLEYSVFLTCLLPELYPGFNRVFGFLQDDATASYPTVGLLMECYGADHGGRESVRQLFHPGSTLKFWRLIVPVGDDARVPPLKRSFRVDERIVDYLMGKNRCDGDLVGIVTLQEVAGEKESVGHAPALESIVKGVEEQRACHLVCLFGNDKHGAMDFVEAATLRLGWRLLKVPVSALIHRQEWDGNRMEVLLREAVLQPAAVLVYEEDPAGAQLPHMGSFLRQCGNRGMLVFYLGHAPFVADSVEPAIHCTRLEFNVPGARERLRYWQEALDEYALQWPDHVVEQLAVRYPLSEEQVHTMFGRLRLRLNGNANRGGEALQLFNQVINDYMQRPLDDLAQRIETVFDWNDLVAPRFIVDHLKAFRNTIAHQFTVYEKWGAGSKVTRGRGVVALFSGPSGTGKTMAAEVIAHDLGINLYRIDLAGVVSKYIGETEKNIKRIFDSARGTNTLLLFDEADALFGRRTEIQDSHARYANLEVNYLLQRLEEHDGPVILATKRRKNLEEAFLRRIHFIIEFPQPTESLRQVIWQKNLPPAMPRAEDVDTAFLAKHFEITGGDIKNAALQSAFLCAADGGVLGMEHVLAALKREYLKLGKVFPGSEVNHLSGRAPESPDTRRRKKEGSRIGS